MLICSVAQYLWLYSRTAIITQHKEFTCVFRYLFCVSLNGNLLVKMLHLHCIIFKERFISIHGRYLPSFSVHQFFCKVSHSPTKKKSKKSCSLYLGEMEVKLFMNHFHQNFLFKLVARNMFEYLNSKHWCSDELPDSFFSFLLYPVLCSRTIKLIVHH